MESLPVINKDLTQMSADERKSAIKTMMDQLKNRVVMKKEYQSINNKDDLLPNSAVYDYVHAQLMKKWGKKEEGEKKEKDEISAVDKEKEVTSKNNNKLAKDAHKEEIGPRDPDPLPVLTMVGPGLLDVPAPCHRFPLPLFPLLPPLPPHYLPHYLPHYCIL